MAICSCSLKTAMCPRMAPSPISAGLRAGCLTSSGGWRWRTTTERKFTESMQAVIYAISEAAHTTHNLQALFQHIHQIIGRLLPATNFAVALYDACSDSLSFPYHVNEPGAAPTPPAPVQDALCAEVIHSGSTLLLTPDTPDNADPRAAQLRRQLPQEHAPLYWLGVPLQTQKGAN